jgi:carbonic anhydrase
VVLGHERCGAVDAALNSEPGHGGGHDRVPSILNRIVPAITGIAPNLPPAARLDEAVQRNVRYTAKLLASSSEIIRRAATEAHIPIQGAYYSVASGKVTKIAP